MGRKTTGEMETMIKKQPKPTGNGKWVFPEVMKDLLQRVAEGNEEYGTPLKTNNGRDALQDAYEEAMDMTLYLKQAIMERDGL